MVHQVESPQAAGDVFERAGGVVEVRELRERDVAVIRDRAPMDELKDVIGRDLVELMATCRHEGIVAAGPPFVRYLSWADLVDMEIGMPVASVVRPAGRIVPSHLPGGSAATLIHVGPYEDLERSYARMAAWFSEHAITPGTTMWETYWSDPRSQPDPSTWRTEMVWPFG